MTLKTGWKPTQLESLQGKTIVITGATSGVGREAVRILLSKEASVVMLNRNEEKSNDTVHMLKKEFGSQAEVRFITMDLADLASVRKAAKEVLTIVPKVDALICNAAIAQVPKRVLTVDGFESHLGTNHYGHFLLSGMLFKRIEESSGRIVVVTSLGYKMGLRTINFDDMNWEKGYKSNPVYSQSKLAQMMFAYELQDRVDVAKKNIEVYVCHPGASATSLIKTSGNRTTRLLFGLMTKTPLVQSAEKGAYPEVMCATQDGLEQRALYGPTGRLNMVGPVAKNMLEAYAYEKEAMQKLWKVSEEATGFTWPLS